VNVREATKVNIHAVLLKIASGQLPFLGSIKPESRMREIRTSGSMSGMWKRRS
jgi:hypothetical protein